MNYSYKPKYPAGAGKTNHSFSHFDSYLAKEDEKKKTAIPPLRFPDVSETPSSPVTSFIGDPAKSELDKFEEKLRSQGAKIKNDMKSAANAVATNRDAIIFNPARANYDAYGLDRAGYTGNITAFVAEGEPLDVALDSLSTFLWFIPQQETNTYEQKRENNLIDFLKMMYGGLAYNIYRLIKLHGMQTVIDILSGSDKK